MRAHWEPSLMAIPILFVWHTCVSPEKTSNTGLVESIQTVTWDNLLNSIFNLPDFPVVSSGSNANALQQVSGADGPRHAVMSQEQPQMLFILGLHCGCYTVLVLYFLHIFIPNSSFKCLSHKHSLLPLDSTGLENKPIISWWEESTVHSG